MAPPQPRRSMGPLIAIIGVVIIVVVAVLGYAVAGYAYAQGRLNSARSAYNSVVDHENKYTDAMNSFESKMTNGDLNTATTAQIQQKKTLVTQFVDASNQAQAQVDSDDSSLVKADGDLKANSWLTVINKSDIDKASTRINHMRNALADAKKVTTDYVQLGTFYESFYDVILDEDAVGTAAQGQSLSGIAAAVAKLKTDAGKAIPLDNAPGLAPGMDAYLKDVQTIATDFTTLLDAAARGDQVGFDAADAAVQKDATKLDSYDFAKMDSTTQAFFKPLIDDFNSEVDKANNT